jgi:hypothetical protein
MEESRNWNNIPLSECKDVPAPTPGLSALIPLGLTEVTDQPRPLPERMDYEQPLISLCWRILREDRERFRLEQERQLAAVEGALTSLALEAHALGRCLRANTAGGEAGLAVVKTAGMEGIGRRMLRALEACEVRLLTPEGEPFAGNLTEMFDNVAQRPEPGLTEARIAEVVTPAVLWKGRLCRQGKAVIAVPVAPSAQKAAASPPVE